MAFNKTKRILSQRGPELESIPSPSCSVVNWLLGRGIERFRGTRWFPVGEKQLDRVGSWYRKYGWWSLLLSWVPVIGDPLTVAAGVMREPFARFLLVVSIAKFGRYIALAALVLHWT